VFDMQDIDIMYGGRVINHANQRLFFAVQIPAEVKEALLPVQALFKPTQDIRPVLPEQLHITLLFLGNKIIDFEKLDDFFYHSSFGTKKECIAHVWGFEWKKVSNHWAFWAVVRAAVLHDLAIRLMHVLEMPLIEPSLHITLFRAPEIIIKNDIQFDPIEFAVVEIVLLSSVVSMQGREYSVIKKYRL
jgi:2'-5' RNA ligase